MRSATRQGAAKSLLALTAADVMSAPVLTIPQDTSLREAARQLHRSGISGAPVVGPDGCCLGVLSSSDFVTWAEKGGKEGKEVSFIAPWGEIVNVEDAPDDAIRNYMTVQPVSVAPTTPLGDVAQMMIDAHIHRVLVVEDNRPCGILTSTDVLAAVAQAARKEARPAGK